MLWGLLSECASGTLLPRRLLGFRWRPPKQQLAMHTPEPQASTAHAPCGKKLCKYSLHMAAMAVAVVWARLIELALVQEQLEQHGESAHGRQLLHQAAHVVGCLRPVGGVEADVKVEAMLRVLKLDDGHLRLADDLQSYNCAVSPPSQHV